MNKFTERHIKLIKNSGGVIEDNLFVRTPGIMITKKSRLTDKAKELFNIMNIDDSEDEASQHAEFNSRITYMAFKDIKESSRAYNDAMINEYGHLSVYNDEYITFLIAGCSVETELEFVAHNEATVARLTSSKTAAQDEPLYVLLGKRIDIQKEIIKEQIKLKKMWKKEFTDKDHEFFNMNTFGTKAVSFTITMSLKDWHKTLIGRLSNHGVEKEMLMIMEEIALKLKKEYPYLIKDIQEYYEMGNDKKLN